MYIYIYIYIYVNLEGSVTDAYNSFAQKSPVYAKRALQGVSSVLLWRLVLSSFAQKSPAYAKGSFAQKNHVYPKGSLAQKSPVHSNGSFVQKSPVYAKKASQGVSSVLLWRLVVGRLL